MYLMDQFSWTQDIIETLSIYKTYIGVDHGQRQQHGEQPHQQQRLPGHGGAEIRARCMWNLISGILQLLKTVIGQM